MFFSRLRRFSDLQQTPWMKRSVGRDLRNAEQPVQ